MQPQRSTSSLVKSSPESLTALVGGQDPELGEAVDLLRLVAEGLGLVEVGDLAADLAREGLRIEQTDPTGAALAGAGPFPELGGIAAEGADRPPRP